ncbi:MAG: alpha-L-rhamnosidase [Salibacteraceae bacterium]
MSKKTAMKKTVIILIGMLSLVSCQKSDQTTYSPIDLRCEYAVNPNGIDTDAPRFTWRLPTNSGVKMQGYYQVLVGTEATEIAMGNTLVWDSGKIKSDAGLIKYNGEKLQPNTNYFWAVKVWDKQGNESLLSEIASFQTGIKGNWSANWITDVENVDEKKAPYFKKEIKTQSPIAKATVYMASAGLHELEINGKRVGDAFMNPTYTRFDKRVLYNTYDVTSLLITDNVIDVVLGNGWYNHQSTAVWDFHKAHWRARPRFSFEMLLEYKDGTTESVISDKSWKTTFGKIQFNSIYTAEHVNNNKVVGDWKNAIEVASPTELISSQQLPPVRKVTKYPAISCEKVADNTYLFDFGQNMSGITELKIAGSQGTEVRIKHGEQLKAGRINNEGLAVHYRPTDDTDPFQTDIYTLSGIGEEVFAPKFNYKGFRYAEVATDSRVELNAKSLTAYFTHSDVTPVGSIETSNELINKIWDATNKAYLSNLFGYPTDCPQREKNGWTGDGHIAIETGLFNFDGILVYEKWMDDHRDEQQADGTLPAIIPTSGWGYTWANGPDWTSSMVLVPWNVYKFYGDSRILKENYESMKSYVNKIKSVAKDNLTDWGLGDWVPIKTTSNVEFTSSIFYYTDALIVSKTARVLGNEKEALEFEKLALEIKSAINKKYFEAENNTYASGTQTEMSMALFRGIVAKEKIQLVADNLAKSIVENNSKMDVGLLGSKCILNALSQNGYADLAYEITASKEFPSWGYWIANGATTLYENWDLSAESDVSLNHIMFGEIGAWYYKALGGINIDEKQPGFKNTLLQPHFVKGLEDFKASHKGPFGTIISEWKRVGGTVNYKVVVPLNSIAELRFDDSVKQVTKKGKMDVLDLSMPVKLEAGVYEFVVE